MDPSAAVIETFYTAFQNKDYGTMQRLYADDARFTDEVFINLTAPEVRAMWEMLIKRGKDLQIEFDIVSAAPQTVEVRWIARYSFSKSGNVVVNKIEARFHVKNGLIVKHIDSFDFHTWAGQALGLPGKLLGWTSWMRRKVQRTADHGLRSFMASSTQ